MNIVVISIFVLSLIIYLTENVYWYNGVEFSEALEAGTEKRKAYALSHMKRFGGFTGIFIVYSCISILIGIPKGIDIIIAVVGLITTAISTIHIKLWNEVWKFCIRLCWWLLLYYSPLLIPIMILEIWRYTIIRYGLLVMLLLFVIWSFDVGENIFEFVGTGEITIAYRYPIKIGEGMLGYDYSANKTVYYTDYDKVSHWEWNQGKGFGIPDLDKVVFPTPNRPGYEFLGWYSAETGGTLVTADMDLRSYADLYARYNILGTPIIYDGNGSTGGSTEQSILFDIGESALSTNGFTKTSTITFDVGEGTSVSALTPSHSFNSWNTKADGTGTSYSDGQTGITNIEHTGDEITLYAKWDDTSITLPSPTWTNHVLVGWGTSADGEADAGAPGETYTVTGDQTLYAKWRGIYYTVNYDGNGNTDGETESDIHEYGVSKALRSNGFEKEVTITFDAATHGGECNTTSKTENCTFKEWYTNSSGEGGRYTANVYNCLYYSPITFTITLFLLWPSNSA